MKRVTYFLLIIVLTQFLGLKGWCASAVPASHDCCPPGQEMPAQASTPLPDCCVATVARDQGGVAQPRTEQESVGTVLMVENHADAKLVLPAPSPISGISGSSYPISPPISPLLQTCLLLI